MPWILFWQCFISKSLENWQKGKKFIFLSLLPNLGFDGLGLIFLARKSVHSLVQSSRKHFSIHSKNPKSYRRNGIDLMWKITEFLTIFVATMIKWPNLCFHINCKGWIYKTKQFVRTKYKILCAYLKKTH